jgi:alpha-tubulin suppressor-like RCC1 family protein
MRSPTGWIALLAVVASGFLAACGAGTPTDAAPDPDPTPDPLGTLVSIAAGASHSCAVNALGRVFCWGANGSGQLGTGTWGPGANSRPAPVAQGGQAFSSVDVGEDHSCALDARREISCWGSDATRQLGYFTDDPLETCGALPCSTFPREVIDGTRFGSFTTGYGYSCASTPLGSLYCWGTNRLGQSGSGGISEKIAYASPVTGQHLARLVRAGPTHACAVDTDGSTYCWGETSDAQLGSEEPCPGFVDFCPIPLLVAAPTPFVDVAPGGDFTCGLTADGAAYCWGSGAAGALGTGGVESEATPAPVASPVQFVSLTAGDRHACGLTAAGEIYCWGTNVRGQLGLGPAGPAIVPTPEKLPGSLTYTQVDAGAEYTCALTSAGGAVCWGANDFGQLGDGSTQDRRSPVRVSAGA